MLEPPLLNTRGFWELGRVVRSDEARAQILAERLTADRWFDVIILCELFASHARRTVGEAFARAGYHLATCTPESRIFASSGLFIASRHRIVERSFAPFLAASGSDRLARKGILHVKLATAYGPLDVFATHLQASPGAAAVRRKQLVQARAFIDARTDARGVHPALVGGDLNVIGELTPGPTEEYRAMRDIFRGYADAHQLLTGGQPLPTWNPLENAQMIGAGHADLERLDYLLLRDDHAERALARDASVEVLRFEHEGLSLSDHYALSFELPL